VPAVYGFEMISRMLAPPRGNREGRAEIAGSSAENLRPLAMLQGRLIERAT
jgi:hypothetical protein